jgi:hypothetical protein
MKSCDVRETNMITIRLPKRQWAMAWRAMIGVAPVRLVAADPIYEVLPAHLELLDKLGVSYEMVRPAPTQKDRRPSRHHKAAPQGGRDAATG